MQTQLNSLSATDLQTQVNLIKSDLTGWVSDNFTLDTDQQAYLKSIDPPYMELAAALTGFAVANKLPVKLIDNGPKKTFKFVQLSNDIVASFSANGFTVTGGVTYTESYSS